MIRRKVDYGLSGQVALVTGAASGIGRATAELFAAGGARVVASDIDAERGAATATELTEVAMRAQIEATLAGGGGGTIVNVSSTLGLRGSPMASPYSAGKHGVIGLTRTAPGRGRGGDRVAQLRRRIVRHW